jgi:hypothetical protein
VVGLHSTVISPVAAWNVTKDGSVGCGRGHIDGSNSRMSANNGIDKEKLVTAARVIYNRRHDRIRPEMGCLYWARSFNEAAIRAGLDCLIQVGSAQFQYRADTDGVSSTHFSYMFDPVEASVRIHQGLPPEMHAWNVLRKTWEVVDLTTGFQAQQAQRLLGYEWEKEFALPEYFWGKPDGERMIYRAHPAATIYGLKMLML